MPRKRRAVFNPTRIDTEKKKVSSENASEALKEKELEADRRRKQTSFQNETFEEKSDRLEANRQRNIKSRQIETSDVTHVRLQIQRERQGKLRANNWLYLKEEAFHYDPSLEYMNFPQVLIGKMDNKCNFCGALKFKGETPGLCCSNGKVKLPNYDKLPEPLNSLMNGDHQKSKEFLNLIRKYNSSFQMTSFGTSVPMNKNKGFMPTFSIQGQVYHKGGSLLPLPHEDAKFLQIYFLGDEEAEAQRRCSIIPGIDKKLIISLQKMLHEHNHYVRTFKTALDENLQDDMKIVIKADKKPHAGHARVFNEPTVRKLPLSLLEMTSKTEILS